MKIYKTFCREELEKLPSNQLDQMLHDELNKESKDSELILALMHILEERESGAPTPDIGEAWQTFVDRYNSKVEAAEPVRKKKSLYRWIGTAAAAVAVFFLVSFGIPKAAGFENIFVLIARWTDDCFTLSQSGDDMIQNEYVFNTDNAGLQQVYDAVVELGVTDPVVPIWIPEGYELSELKTIQLDDGIKIFARFINGKKEISLSYKLLFDHQPSQLPKDEGDADIFEHEGVLYNILLNEENETASWSVGNMICLLSVKDPEVVLRNIIKSIS